MNKIQSQLKQNFPSLWNPSTKEVEEILYKATDKLAHLLCMYHRYEVINLEEIPVKGPALLVCNHSLATYDTFLLGYYIKEKLNRSVKGLADRLIFRTPGMKQWFSAMGFVEGTRESAIQLLKQGELVGLAPGGMRESLRSSEKKFQIDWQGRMGFVHVSMEAQVPIILCACPFADEIFEIYESPITHWVYQKFRFPFPLFRGLGLSTVPRPIKLCHFLSEPIFPPKILQKNKKEWEKAMKDHHHFLETRMTKLLQKGIQFQKKQV